MLPNRKQLLTCGVLRGALLDRLSRELLFVLSFKVFVSGTLIHYYELLISLGLAIPVICTNVSLHNYLDCIATMPLVSKITWYDNKFKGS